MSEKNDTIMSVLLFYFALLNKALFHIRSGTTMPKKIRNLGEKDAFLT